MTASGLDEWQEQTNRRMRAGNDPGSPADLMCQIERLRASNTELLAVLERIVWSCDDRAEVSETLIGEARGVIAAAKGE